MPPLPHELRAGDVVMYNSTPHTILTVTNVGVDAYALYNVTFSDGKVALINAAQQVTRVHPPDAPDSADSPA